MFNVQLAVEKERFDVLVKHRQTLREFREAVSGQHNFSISNHVLISVGRELKAEDATLEELGILSGYTIYAGKLVIPVLNMKLTGHAVTDVKLHITGGPEDLDIVVHPLTRISDIRKKMEEIFSDTIISHYWFTTDGIHHLNESRRLYDLGITSSGTLILSQEKENSMLT
jgi:hypothetical protein